MLLHIPRKHPHLVEVIRQPGLIRAHHRHIHRNILVVLLAPPGRSPSSARTPQQFAAPPHTASSSPEHPHPSSGRAASLCRPWSRAPATSLPSRRLGDIRSRSQACRPYQLQPAAPSLLAFPAAGLRQRRSCQQFQLVALRQPVKPLCLPPGIRCRYTSSRTTAEATAGSSLCLSFSP